jgi:two-component system C4-dicarboxylate transport response regulator DctD
MNSTVEAMRAGAYDYLTKPVDPDRLLQTLRKADERRRLIIEIVPYSVV